MTLFYMPAHIHVMVGITGNNACKLENHGTGQCKARKVENSVRMDGSNA
jgi:hypothetical protein